MDLASRTRLSTVPRPSSAHPTISSNGRRARHHRQYGKATIDIRHTSPVSNSQLPISRDPLASSAQGSAKTSTSAQQFTSFPCNVPLGAKEINAECLSWQNKDGWKHGSCLKTFLVINSHYLWHPLVPTSALPSYDLPIAAREVVKCSSICLESHYIFHLP